MAKETDIAWKPILICAGTGIAGIAIGTFLIAPMIQKAKAKKELAKKATGTKK